MGGELKEKVAQGVAWSMAEKIGSMLLAMAVRLVILRLLTRDILGFMSIPSAVVTVLLVIVDSGFSQSLVRHKGPSQSDYKSVFLFNIAVSAVLYGVLVALAPLAARWYGMPEIARIAPVFFLLLPLNALCAVQNTICVRQFRFALLSKVTFLSSLAGGLTAIALALAGWGIWSLVAERVIAVGMRTALLWWLSDWRPCGKCGLKPLREMAPFGCSLMVTDLISNFYNKIPQFFLGKLYSPAVLGSFDQAVKLKDMPAATGIQAVQNVTFPALAKIRDDAPKFAEGYRQVVMVVSYVMFPIMLGMSAVARDMFAVLLGEEWMPTVPYFEAVCLAGLFSPIALTAYNVLKARCKGPLIVRLEVVKKIIMTAIFAVTIPHSVMAVVWGLVAIAFCEMAVNFLATMRFTSLTFRRFVRTLLPVALVSGTMYLLVRLTAAAIPGNDLVRLLAELATGVVSAVPAGSLPGGDDHRAQAAEKIRFETQGPLTCSDNPIHSMPECCFVRRSFSRWSADLFFGCVCRAMNACPITAFRALFSAGPTFRSLSPMCCGCSSCGRSMNWISRGFWCWPSLRCRPRCSPGRW